MAMLPHEILLNDQLPGRQVQIKTLATLFNPSFPTPTSLVLHGLQATGKTAVTRAVLKALKTPHAVIDSRECITGRQLLERSFAASVEALSRPSNADIDISDYGRCENLSALQVNLERLLEKQKSFTLVFDGIDQQREAPLTLIPALARFGETIPCLTVVFIISVPSPRLFHTIGIPHIHFPFYTRDESIRILSQSPPSIFLAGIDSGVDYTEQQAAEDDAWVWGRFTAAVWDSLARGAARDLLSFRAVCDKLWRPFTAPIVDGTFGTRDFARLMVSRRTLFQSEDALISGVITKGQGGIIKSLGKARHELPYYSKFILCASYLASYNPARQDQIFFMKAAEKKRKKKGGGTAAGRKAQHRKIPRSMLAASPFSLDRMLAILRAILPQNLPQNADVLTQISTLASLRLLARASAASVDVLDASCRWRINCGWDYVAALGRSIGLEHVDAEEHGQLFTHQYQGFDLRCLGAPVVQQLNPHAAKHHFFVGSYGTPSIYGLEFDNVANSLLVTKNNTTRKENEWLAISHDAKTLYSSGADGWSSFPITSNTTLGTQSPSTPGSGNCGAWNGVYVMASRKAPYPLYGSLNCANWVSTGPEGEVGKATALPYNEASVIYGMATDPTYSYLYSSDWRNGKIWTHKIGSDGSLTVVGFTESPSNTSAPRTLQVHPSGKNMYVILEAWNAMALYSINETTHMPHYTNALYPLIPPDVVAGNYGAQSAVLSPKGSILWATSHSRIIGQQGYLSGFSLREDGLPINPLFRIKTRNSGGKSLNVAASPFKEGLVAVAESYERSIYDAQNTTASSTRAGPPCLLQLPRELRDKILRSILRASTVIQPINHSYATRNREDVEDWAQKDRKIYNTILGTRILRVNKQMLAEGRGIPYGENRILIECPFQLDLPIEALQHSSRLFIHVKQECRDYRSSWNRKTEKKRLNEQDKPLIDLVQFLRSHQGHRR
ncbi:4-aminobutyrate aminotransferase [Venturia nashicola]|nr:4-aminobutyrate aminotransferase [Venturia nashicola]